MSMITWLVDGFHVMTPEREIAEFIQAKVKAWETLTNTQRADILHEALDAHRANRNLYRLVMGGHIR